MPPGSASLLSPLAARGKSVYLLGSCQGLSVQVWALEEPAGLARLTSATTSGYLALYVAVSKQIIIEW